jgi:hypothetical protein
MGEHAPAAALVQEAYAGLNPRGSFQSELWVFTADAELGLARGDGERATAAGERLLQYLERTGIRPYRGDALYFMASGLQLQDGAAHGETAGRLLNAALDEARRLGSRRSQWPISLALSDLARRRGDHSVAAALREGAAECVQYIAEHAGTPERRASFLALPQVRAALAE